MRWLLWGAAVGFVLAVTVGVVAGLIVLAVFAVGNEVLS